MLVKEEEEIKKEININQTNTRGQTNTLYSRTKKWRKILD